MQYLCSITSPDQVKFESIHPSEGTNGGIYLASQLFFRHLDIQNLDISTWQILSFPNFSRVQCCAIYWQLPVLQLQIDGRIFPWQELIRLKETIRRLHPLFLQDLIVHGIFLIVGWKIIHIAAKSSHARDFQSCFL